MVGRVIDSLIVFRFLKMLVTPFNKTPAFKFGFIDEKGTRIKFLPDPDNPNQKLPNNPKSKEEKNAHLYWGNTKPEDEINAHPYWDNDKINNDPINYSLCDKVETHQFWGNTNEIKRD